MRGSPSLQGSTRRRRGWTNSSGNKIDERRPWLGSRGRMRRLRRPRLDSAGEEEEELEAELPVGFDLRGDAPDDGTVSGGRRQR